MLEVGTHNQDKAGERQEEGLLVLGHGRMGTGKEDTELADSLVGKRGADNHRLPEGNSADFGGMMFVGVVQLTQKVPDFQVAKMDWSMEAE